MAARMSRQEKGKKLDINGAPCPHHDDYSHWKKVE